MINTQGLIALILTYIVPLILAIIGVMILAGARKGKVSDAANTTVIVIIGIVFLVGAAGFIALGRTLSTTGFGG